MESRGEEVAQVLLSIQTKVKTHLHEEMTKVKRYPKIIPYYFEHDLDPIIYVLLSQRWCSPHLRVGVVTFMKIHSLTSSRGGVT